MVVPAMVCVYPGRSDTSRARSRFVMTLAHSCSNPLYCMYALTLQLYGLLSAPKTFIARHGEVFTKGNRNRNLPNLRDQQPQALLWDRPRACPPSGPLRHYLCLTPARSAEPLFNHSQVPAAFCRHHKRR